MLEPRACVSGLCWVCLWGFMPRAPRPASVARQERVAQAVRGLVGLDERGV